MVSIRDGNEFKQNLWIIVPSAKPDIYEISSKKSLLLKRLEYKLEKETVSL